MIGGQSVYSQVVASLPNVAMVLAVLRKWACWSKKSTAKMTEK